VAVARKRIDPAERTMLDLVGVLQALDAARLSNMQIVAPVEVVEEPPPKEKPRESLLDFIPRVSPRFRRPEHLAPLANVLERAHREPLRVLVSTPPRHAKTETILHGIAYMLEDDPRTMVGYVSYQADLARSKSRAARDYARAAGVPQRSDADALQEWLTTHGGGMRAAGMGGPLTGQGMRVLIIDDPTKNRQEAESALIRQRNWDWFTSTALTRLEPDGSVIVCHTRWHEDDLIGRCLKQKELWDATNGADGENWIHINLQAIDDTTGLALWPEQWPLKKLNRKRSAIGEYDWSSLYQGRSRPRDSKPFGTDPARYERRDLTGKRIAIACDIAGTSKTRSNWTVVNVFVYWWVVHEELGDLLCIEYLEIHRWQEEIPEGTQRLFDLQKRWAIPFIVEASGLGAAVVQTLRKLAPALDITPVYPHADKYLRSQAYSAAWKSGRIFYPHVGENVAESIAVHKAFTGMSDPIDDDVDAGAHGYNWAFDQGPFYDSIVEPTQETDFEDDYRFGDQRGY
jgi:phage terminase large subunit-like protein